jgi:hypothetical protein
MTLPVAQKMLSDPNVWIGDNGRQLNHAILKDVMMVPSSVYNLFSLTKLMSAEWKLIGEKDKLTSKKGNQEIIFDIAVQTPKGVVYALYIKRDGEISRAVMNKKITV